MDTTFITIHDLSDDARVLYSSDSIVDILGHTPDEVLNRSCWEFFHPDEVPLARRLHSRGVHKDKAAVLAYCRLMNRRGDWVTCECCFSIVYDVMVVCTSVYRSGIASQKRAVEAPLVRRLFSSSPKDPHYHMLSHLSAKFKQAADDQTHEPRAALFLNRFTRTLTIMYTTTGIQRIIGIPNENMTGRSFYYCIAENCLEDAVKCLETAKSNDSIAYLRFWFRDPRQDDQADPYTSDARNTDASVTDVAMSEDDEDDRVQLAVGQSEPSALERSPTPSHAVSSSTGDSNETQGESSRISSGNSQNPAAGRTTVPGERTTTSASSLSTVPTSSESDQPQGRAIELEAVVSCTSDGLVVCLRRARPPIPHIVQDLPAVQSQASADRLFVAPRAIQPVYFPPQPLLPVIDNYSHYPGMGRTYAPAARVPRGPAQVDLMNRIREVAVFAWTLTGINGSLTDYAVDKPAAESQSPDDVTVPGHFHGCRIGNSPPESCIDSNIFSC